MAEDVYIVTEDADGHEISGTYRVTDDIIRVTLSANGHSIREHLRGTAAEEPLLATGRVGRWPSDIRMRISDR